MLPEGNTREVIPFKTVTVPVTVGVSPLEKMVGERRFELDNRHFF